MVRAVVTYAEPGAKRETVMADLKSERAAELWIEERKAVDPEGVEAGHYSLVLHDGEGDCTCRSCRAARK